MSYIKKRRTVRQRLHDIEYSIALKKKKQPYYKIADSLGITKSQLGRDIDRYKKGLFDNLSDEILDSYRLPVPKKQVKVRVLIADSCTSCYFHGLEYNCEYPAKQRRASSTLCETFPPDCPLPELTITVKNND